MPKKYKPLIGKDGEVRPLRKSDKVIFRPLRESMVEMWGEEATEQFMKANKAGIARRGRPKSAAPKKLQSFKLSQDVINAIRKSGAGFNVRVEKALREALAEGKI